MKHKIKLQKLSGFFKNVSFEKREWRGMPEFDNYEKAVKQIILHFETYKDAEDFGKFIGQKVTKKTKYLWYPKKEKQKIRNLVYKSES